MLADAADVTDRLGRFRNDLLLIAEARCAGFRPSLIEAEDVVQETLRRAFDKRHQFRGRSDRELGGWLRAILASMIAQFLRKAGHRVNVRSLETALERSSDRLEQFLNSHDPSPSQNARTAERNERLHLILSQLGKDQRRALVLHHIEGKSVAEVAVIMDRTTASIASLLHRGVEAMKKQLGHDV
jgi:RNA polymerase sigma-70 factor (ECF subfamily)